MAVEGHAAGKKWNCGVTRPSNGVKLPTILDLKEATRQMPLPRSALFQVASFDIFQMWEIHLTIDQEGKKLFLGHYFSHPNADI